jgi:FtsZ-interacting cell division protein ZipA
MPASLLLSIAIVILLFIALQRNQRRRQTLVRSSWQLDRVRQLNRLLEQTIEEPDYPDLPPMEKERPPQRSRNENSREFQEILKALRQSHPHRSEAWRWDEAQRRMGRKE